MSISEYEIRLIEEDLHNRFNNGTSPEEVMKVAIESVASLARRHFGVCNTLILNMQQHRRTHLNLVNEYFHRVFDVNGHGLTFKYGIWIFDSGTVDHTRCDGGWINWAFSGRFKRSGHQNGFVEFEGSPRVEMPTAGNLGLFSRSSYNIRLDNNCNLVASCATRTGSRKTSSISLNSNLSNEDGSFQWKRNGNFAATARAVRLENEGSEGSVLFAELQMINGTWQQARIRLDERIENSDGNLQVVSG